MKVASRRYFLIFCSIGLSLFLSNDLFSYDRTKAKNYADQWAYGRNPDYKDYSEEGGDCTNFVSQCLIAGGMRFASDQASYIDPKGCIIRVADMPGALTGFHGAIISVNTIPSNLKVGDVISFGAPIWNPGQQYTHTVIVTEAGNTLETIKVNAHTNDRYHEPLTTYAAVYDIIRYIHLPDSPIVREVRMEQNNQTKYYAYHNYKTNKLVVKVSGIVGVGQLRIRIVFDTSMKTISNPIVNFGEGHQFQYDTGWTQLHYPNILGLVNIRFLQERVQVTMEQIQ